MLGFLFTTIHYALSQSNLSCKSECPLSWIGDGICNQECMNLGCNFDSPLYDRDKYLTLLASDCSAECSCGEELLINNLCDPECDKFECGFDLGACGYCASGCYLEDLETYYCKDECFDNQCMHYDSNLCNTYCAPGCLIEDLKISCKKECLAINCFKIEENYCKTYECAPGCSSDIIGNNECEPMCNNADCFYDFGDCDCNKGCSDTSGECLTNLTYIDPCDTESCEYKDGKCGFCASGCFEKHLGDGVCQPECNTETCNYDYEDCGCAANCSFKYDTLAHGFIQNGSSEECSLDCLVLECRFGIDFCSNFTLIKLAMMNFRLYKGSKRDIDLSDCYRNGCTSEKISSFLDDDFSICYDDEKCNNKDCFYCMFKYYSNYQDCPDSNLDRCSMCENGIKYAGACIVYKMIYLPWYEINEKFVVKVGIWYFREAAQYSTSNYKELFVNSSTPQEQGNPGEIQFKSLYLALVTVYADYTKIFIVDKEVDYYLDETRISPFATDIHNPLNIHTGYKTRELWIIGNYSTEEKTVIYWKDDLLFTSQAKRLYIKNIEFIGKYNMDKFCVYETCYYCPYIIKVSEVYKDDKGLEIPDSNLTNYSQDCSSYSSINVFSINHDAYMEDVNFVDFRYQFNSLIKFSGKLKLKNVNFHKIQAKPDGSVILFECSANDCLKTSFTYSQGEVVSLGAGNNDGFNVSTGSFFKSSDIGYITITNITFSFNFVHHNLRSSNKGYLIYSKNHLGTIVIEDCKFQNNYVDFLVYVDVSSLTYPDYRINKGISKAYSQQHFYMNNIQISEIYCSKSMIYYIMNNLAHNIQVTDLVINSSVAGDDGFLTIVHSGSLQVSDTKGEIIQYPSRKYIQLVPRLLKLSQITTLNSCTGKSVLNIQNYPNINIENLFISNITDCSSNQMHDILSSLVSFELHKVFDYIHADNIPDLNCSQMVLLSNPVNLLIDSMNIEGIECKFDDSPMGLSLNKIIESALLKNLVFSDIEDRTRSGLALTVTDSNSIEIIGMKINKLRNFNESIINFEKCNRILLDKVEIENVESNYFSPFTVARSSFFTLSNFYFKNMTSIYSSGGCLHLLTGTSGGSFKIQYGTLTECFSINSKGGVYLDSMSKKAATSLEMYNVEITNCQTDEGSAIYISNTVTFGNEKECELVNLLISNNICEGGGTISDYHYAGTVKIEGMKMIDNNYGLYVFYSNSYSQLQIFDSKIYASNSVSTVIYLTSLISGVKAFFYNVEFYNAVMALEAYNFQISIDKMLISDSFQALYFNNKVKCQAKGLRIAGTEDIAISISKYSSFYCINCEFTRNLNSIIEAINESNFTLADSEIFSNVLGTGHMLYVTSGSKKENFLLNCLIHSNSISKSIIYSISTFFTIKDCSIINNEGTLSSIRVIYSLDTVLEIFNSKLQFNSFVTVGAFFFAETDSIVTAENTVFHNSYSSFGNVYGRQAIINLNNCTFSGNKGGDIYTESSSLTVINCEFENTLLTKTDLGAVGIVSNLNSIIKGSNFRNISSSLESNSPAYIFSDLSEKLEIINCSLRGPESNITAVFVKESYLVTIRNSEFIGFNTKAYSALTAISDTKKCELRIYNSLISDNLSSKSGGGVYSENYNLIFENTEISFNTAHDSGGGVYFTSQDCEDCGLYLIGTTKVFENSCGGDGGAIKWKDYKPYIENPDLIYNNSAAYGANFASTPAMFGLSSSRRLSDTIIVTLSDIPPGKIFTDAIQVFIYDTYGQVVETENSITATLLVNQTLDSTIAISGITTFKAKSGVLNITDFVLAGKPGSSAYLELKSDNMISSGARNDDTEYMNSAFIKVDFRNCTNGEQIQASACINCIGGNYNLQASENCLDCPTGASCPGGAKIIVKNGYWRSSLKSDVIYACDVFEACLKGTETNELGNCSTGYSGVLCKSCETGYLKTASGVCGKCPNKKTTIISIILLCMGILTISFLLVKTTLTSAFSPKALHSIYIKIFTNYLQLVFIVTQFDLEWPSYVIGFFNVQRSTASLSDQLFSLDCYIGLSDSGGVENMYYTKICMISALPIVVMGLSYLYWIFYSFIFESYRWLKREVFTTIIVLFFLVYPTIVKIMFSNFSCVEVDKMKSYLNENTAIECWDFNHKKYSFIVVIPSIIIWVVGIPTLLLTLMTKNRRRLHLDNYRVVYGFLYNGYKQNRFYWEINIMYRKILLITITVFKISQARVLQALNLIIVLLASIYLHHSYRPYNSSQLNNMEMQALNIAAITIYFGLYYLSKSISEAIKILLFIFIILGNSYFICYWIYYMGNALIDIFIKFFPRFKSLLKRGDAFDEEFYKEEIIRKGVYRNPLEGKNAFTFINFEKLDDGEVFRYRSIEEAYRDVAKRDIERPKTLKPEE